MCGVKVNCKYNERGFYCKNKNVKRSLFGIGARLCSCLNFGEDCSYKESYPKPLKSPYGGSNVMPPKQEEVEVVKVNFKCDEDYIIKCVKEAIETNKYGIRDMFNNAK